MQGWVDGAAVINEKGGVKIGDENYKLKIITYDTKGTVADARAATTRLVETGQGKVCIQSGGCQHNRYATDHGTQQSTLHGCMLGISQAVRKEISISFQS